MCREEIQNKEDRKHWKRMDRQADRIHKSLVGQLSPTTEEWIRGRKNYEN